MAERLVEDMTGEWDPTQYKDEYANDLLKVIHEKVASGDVHAINDKEEAPAPTKRGEILDLMPLLKRSVEAAHGTGRKKTAKRPAHKGTVHKKSTRRSA